MPNTLFDPYLQFAFWTGVGAVILAVLAAGFIIHLRFALIRRTRREQGFLAVWRPIMVKALAAKPKLPLPILQVHERVFFLRLWVQLQESIRGPESPGLLDLAQRVGCDQFARAMLKEGNPAEQLLCILALGNLRSATDWHLLVGVAQTPDTIRSYSALRALVQIDAARAARELLPLLLERQDWPPARIAALMQSNQEAFALPLLKAAEQAEDGPLVKILRFVEALRLQLPVARLARLLDADQPVEVILGALRVTLAPGVLPEVRGLAAHADWCVRVQVAKVLGRIGEYQDILCLSRLLSDAEWWVRYCAANALIGLPFIGPAQVQDLRDSMADPYARDMLEQVLFEKAAT